MLTYYIDREESTRESDFAYEDEGEEDEEGNDWDGEIEWAGEEVEGGLEGDVPDESAAYIDFLNQEVSGSSSKSEIMANGYDSGFKIRILRR